MALSDVRLVTVGKRSRNVSLIVHRYAPVRYETETPTTKQQLQTR